MNEQSFITKSSVNGKFGMWGVTVLSALICGYFIISGNLIFLLITFVAYLAWIGIYSKIISFEVFSLLTVLLINMFLLKRYDSIYSVSGGGIIFKISFFVTSFSIIVLALKIFFLQLVHKQALSVHDKYGILSPKKLLLFIFIGTVSSLINRENIYDVFDSIYAIIYFVIPICYVYLIPRLQLKRSDIFFILKLIIFIGLLISVITILASIFPGVFMQIFGWKTFGSGSGSGDFIRAALPFGSATGVGAILVLILPMCYFSYYEEENYLGRVFLMSVVILTVVAILTSLSRGPMLVLLFFLIGAIFHKSNRSRIKKYAILLLIVILGAWLIMSYDFSRYRKTDIEARKKNWKVALMISKDNPIFGVAPNSIYKRMDVMMSEFTEVRRIKYVAMLDYFSTTYKGNWTLYNPHNVYLMILAEYGLIGFSIFIYIIAEIINRLRYTIKKNVFQLQDHYILKGMLWGIVAFLLQCLKGGFIINNSKIATFFWIYVGIALCLSSHIGKAPKD